MVAANVLQSLFKPLCLVLFMLGLALYQGHNGEFWNNADDASQVCGKLLQSSYYRFDQIFDLLCCIVSCVLDTCEHWKREC